MAGELDVTAEDAAGMWAKHSKDPVFLKLFGEYAQSLSDPKDAAEMNAYLAQLEAKGQAEAMYGKGVQLIVPEAWFVVKTKDVSGANRVYINICTSPKVAKLELTTADDGSGPKQQLQLPMVVHGKDGKQGTAPDGGPLLVWDLAVNPNAVQHASSSRQALQTLVVMAIERIEQVLGSKLLHEYKLPRLKYKATPAAAQPSVMAARTAEGGQVVDGRLRPLTEAQAPAASPPAPNSAPGSSTAGDESAGRSGFSFSKARPATQPAAAPQPQAAAAHSNPATAGYQHACGAVTPSWQFVERHTRTDLQQTWADTGRGLRAGDNTPKELLVRLQLPGMASAAAVQLDISSQQLHVLVPGRFRLDLGPAQLRHSLLPDKGSARFDKNKQQLTVTLEVAPPPQQHQQQHRTPSPATKLIEEVELQQQLGRQPSEQQQEPAGTAEQGADEPQAEGSEPAVDATVVLTRKPVSDQAAGKTSSQLQWDELHRTLDKQVQQQQQDQQQQDDSSKAAAKGAEQQPPLPYVKPRLLSRRMNALADLD